MENGKFITETLQERIDNFLNKYKCKHHTFPSFENPHGCTDCYNKEFIFDDEESNLINELDDELRKINKENEAMKSYIRNCAGSSTLRAILA